MDRYIKNMTFSDFQTVMIKLVMLVLVGLCVISCKSGTGELQPVSGGLTSVKVNISETLFEGVTAIGSGNKASSLRGGGHIKGHGGIQKSTVAFNSEFDLVMELSAEAPVANRLGASASGAKRAATETNVLKPGVRYKVVAYDNAGKYVLERNYVRGQENTVTDFLLDGGQTYTFVTYSINSTSTLPDVTFTDNSNKTLSGSSVSVNGNLDFLYSSKSQTLLSGVSNDLNVVLKHKFSQITTTIDATATGFNITGVTSVIGPHIPNASIALSTGVISRSGSEGNVNVTFPTLGGATAVGLPNIINAASNVVTRYTIGSITVGPLTQTNINAFTDLSITPGVKYNMKINIIPKDRFLTHAGQSAVLINGQIWMRHNLGANTALNPDQNPSVAGLHGNYYQWGRNVSVAAGSASTVNGNWSGNTVLPNNSWNGGTEAAPVKTSTDPCPAGYGIPTATEYLALISNTTSSTIGSWGEGQGNFSAAKILTSKRKNGVTITFPAQGYFSVLGGSTPPYTATSVNDRGNWGIMHTSTVQSVRTLMFAFFTATSDSNSALLGDNLASKFTSTPIRCIARTTLTNP
ncbi:hypothetical protein D3C73_683040 [compost metagenome]